MKKYFNLLAVLLMFTTILLLTGCGEKREDLQFKGEEGSITFNVIKDKGYKISTDKKDLRTSREQGALVGDNFKIGIEFNDDFNYFFDSDWNKLKKARKDNTEYKEVEYSGMKAIQYFYGGYNCYEVLLPCGDSKEYFLNLSVYGSKDTEKAAKEAIESKEVQDVLNHITEIKSKK